MLLCAPRTCTRRQLELLRQQVLLREANKYRAGTAHLTVGGRDAHKAGGGTGGGPAGYRPLRSVGHGVHPMMRNLAADEVELVVLGSRVYRA